MILSALSVTSVECCLDPQHFQLGGLAQLAERMLSMHEVTGSILVISSFPFAWYRRLSASSCIELIARQQ